MLRPSLAASRIHDVTSPEPSTRAAARAAPALVLLGVILAAALPSRPAVPAESEGPAAGRAQTPGMRTIVIDPGHGGQAVGALGPGGLSEKDVTLDIARRLRDLIARRLGLQVILTREQDVDVPLDERTEKANYWQADLFLSIHANGYRMQQVRGPETYFLSAAASDSIAQRVAASENLGAGAEDDARDDDAAGAADPAAAGVAGQDQALDFILWDLAQTQHLRESSLLAEIIQSNLNGLWQMRDRGVKQAPFRVLKGATMPAVLVEVGYISNEDDAGRLADVAFREQIAETLYRSITAFREQYAVLVGAVPDP